MVLYETRMGSLEESIPQLTQEFIDAVVTMQESSFPILVGHKIHHKLNTPFWQRHATAWDTLFTQGWFFAQVQSVQHFVAWPGSSLFGPSVC